mmetsp:Transcript_41585/g.82028  ORF Transcript_41585/g.82028 Transcript_41585/m.82028 type:complete len:218 (+) Transcript_41585:2763-3416(+)
MDKSESPSFICSRPLSLDLISDKNDDQGRTDKTDRRTEQKKKKARKKQRKEERKGGRKEREKEGKEKRRKARKEGRIREKKQENKRRAMIKKEEKGERENNAPLPAARHADRGGYLRRNRNTVTGLERKRETEGRKEGRREGHFTSIDARPTPPIDPTYHQQTNKRKNQPVTPERTNERMRRNITSALPPILHCLCPWPSPVPFRPYLSVRPWPCIH